MIDVTKQIEYLLFSFFIFFSIHHQPIKNTNMGIFQVTPPPTVFWAKYMDLVPLYPQ